MTTNFGAIVAGAGIWGCTVARLLAESGKQVLVLEKRRAVGGNCRCRIIDGIEVHLYGSHIFHTSNEQVWKFVNRFVHFNDYKHIVLAHYKDNVYHLPIGKTLLEEFFGVTMADKDLKTFLAEPSMPEPCGTGDVEKAITKSWYDVIDPAIVTNMKIISVKSNDAPPADRRAIKDVFQEFGEVVNLVDGRRVTFPAKSAGKMLCQSGIDIRRYVHAFADMFKCSIRAWSEKEAVIEAHKEHRNITAYHQYIVKVDLDGETCFVRFTIREDAGGKSKRNEVHSSTVSRVVVYKAKGAELSDLGHTQVEGPTPFVDNKVAFFLRRVKGTSARTHGAELFDAFIRGYTSKQWGVPPEKVDPAIIARLKVRDNYSTDYFDDPHQGIPLEGYNELFRKMLDHPNIKVRVGAEFSLNAWDGKTPVYYSGPIDQLFDYRFGALPWRSLRFETAKLSCKDFQHAAVVNYTDFAVPYTRIHEFRHYHPEAQGDFARPKRTIITREYPADWQRGDEPYYPIANEESAALLAKYQTEAAKVRGLVVGGRLGAYKYFDMDKSIASAMKRLAER